MGYNTRFTLDVVPITDTMLFIPGAKGKIIEELRKWSEGARFALHTNGESSNEASWYNAQNEIMEFSKKYPLARFILRGEGEKSGDIWALYVVNGKSQLAKAVVTVEPFDPNKLQ